MEQHVEQPGRSYLSRRQEVDERAYPPARQPTQSVPTGRAPQLGHKAAPYLPLRWMRGAPPFRDRRDSARAGNGRKCTA